MKHTRPDWYKQAQNGPFLRHGFTNSNYAKVLQTIESRESIPVTKRRRGGVLFLNITLGLGITALILTIIGTLNPGQFMNTETSSSVLKASDLRARASWVMENIVGKEMMLEKSEAHSEQTLFSYRGTGEDHAWIWIHNKTGAYQVESKAWMAHSSLGRDEEYKLQTELAKQGISLPRNYSVQRHVKDQLVTVTVEGKSFHAKFEQGNIQALSVSKPVTSVPDEVNRKVSAVLKSMGIAQELLVTNVRQVNYYDVEVFDLEIHFGELATVHYDLSKDQIIEIKLFRSTPEIKQHMAALIAPDSEKDVAFLWIMKILDVNLNQYDQVINTKAPGSAQYIQKNSPSITITYSPSRHIYAIRREVYAPPS
ncbi:hypothetical protein ACH6EH_00305 [Paenibacillus sp. JSM ZJ436]|uniref:hypothetical protein n=1 Tax=Paenibacillus sp. JSM ZJ436 TaxID=3376190 RepID=UPI0037A9CF28